MDGSSYIVSLWFVPVTLFILIPLALCFCWLAIRCIRDLADLKVPFYDYFSTRYYLAAEGVQRRREKRRAMTKECTAIISDGRNTCSGRLANISFMGLCVHSVPAAAPAMGNQLSVAIQNGGEIMTLTAMPCWLHENKMGRMLGLEISEEHPLWSSFVVSQ